MKKILLFILIFISIISCSQKEKVLDKKSQKEVYEEIIKDIENMKTFKYTSSDSAMLSFYKGNSVNTFSLDKAGNGFSNQNGVQTYKVDGEVYIRSIGLTQKGETTTVILDSLTKSNTKEDMDYFDRNTMNVKNYLLNNILAELIFNKKQLYYSEFSDNSNINTMIYLYIVVFFYFSK